MKIKNGSQLMIGRAFRIGCILSIIGFAFIKTYNTYYEYSDNKLRYYRFLRDDPEGIIGNYWLEFYRQNLFPLKREHNTSREMAFEVPNEFKMLFDSGNMNFFRGKLSLFGKKSRVDIYVDDYTVTIHDPEVRLLDKEGYDINYWIIEGDSKIKYNLETNKVAIMNIGENEENDYSINSTQIYDIDDISSDSEKNNYKKNLEVLQTKLLNEGKSYKNKKFFLVEKMYLDSKDKLIQKIALDIFILWGLIFFTLIKIRYALNSIVRKR